MPKPCEVNWQLACSAPEYFPNSPEGKYLLLPVHKQHRPALPGSEPERGPGAGSGPSPVHHKRSKAPEKFCSKPSTASSPSVSEEIQPFPVTYHLMLSKLALADQICL